MSQDLKQIIREEYIKCANDPVYFCCKYVKVKTLDKGVMPFKLYDYQERFVKTIHENRFTYEQKGLIKIQDLGDYWEKKNGHPIPLGGIVIRRSIEKEVQKKIDKLIKQSIEYAFSNYPKLNSFITSNAQEMSEAVMLKHIDLYVNKYSLGLGDIGKNAVKKMLQFFNKDLLENPNMPLFVT